MLPWIAVGAGFLSAILWAVAAILQTPLPIGYLSGPPDHVVRRIRVQSWLNAGAAFTAACSVGAQAFDLYNKMPSGG